MIDRHPRQAVRLVWELKPQKRSGGQSIHLSLPAEATTTLALEMPKDWIISVRVGRRRGPLQGGAGDRFLWEVEAETGRIELELFKPEAGGSPGVSDLWVSGATRIDLRGTIDRSGGPVNWSTEWLVELDPRNPRALEVELDPGLELIEVVGPQVGGFRLDSSSGTQRVIVTLGGELKPSTEIRFLANASVPGEGRWAIPAIKPLNATWTGGTTTVLFDRRRVVSGCTERAGRRVAGQGDETDAARRLVFQAVAPRSVAELVFRGPDTESSCFIRGHLFVSGSPVRLECQLDLTAEESLPPELEVELTPGWVTERVLERGVDSAVSWHASRLDSGSTRVQVAIPSSALVRKEVSLVLFASSSAAGRADRWNCRGCTLARRELSTTRGFCGPIRGRRSGRRRLPVSPGSTPGEFRDFRRRVRRGRGFARHLLGDGSSARVERASIVSRSRRGRAGRC